VKVPQKKKQKKNDITLTLGPCHNTKRQNNLDEDSDDGNVPHNPATETTVPTYVCNWAQAIICKFPQLPPMKCQHIDCELLVHHICQSSWEQREGHQDTLACYCCLHHPQYKYQHVVDRSGVSKKQSFLSTNEGQEVSVDVDATITEQNMNVTESVLDGKNEQVRDMSASLTSSKQDTTVSHFNASRKDIKIDGRKYRCNKVMVRGEKKNIVYVKYLQCWMALDKADGSEWKPYNEVKASASTEKVRCFGTLRAEFSMVSGKVISHLYPTNTPHICYNPTAVSGPTPETRPPLMLVFPSQSSKAVIDNMKEALCFLKDHHWINQTKCGTVRQYLKELATHNSLKRVNKQAMAVIQPFMITNVVSQHYKALTLFKVGAICLRGIESQYNQVGSLHPDFDDNVNKKLPEECPQSIILALDPFKLLYEADTGSGGLTDGIIKELHVQRGQAVVFTSSFCHSGGSNYTNDPMGYVYRLFVYIVSLESDYPTVVGTRVKH
jgi:hypothetical protein